MDFNNTQRYIDFTNYLSAAQLYLKQNELLEAKLTEEQIKDNIIGHWGACPTINFIIAHLNNIIKEFNLKSTIVLGTGHSSASILANAFVEGSLGKYYPKYINNTIGFKNLIRDFGLGGINQTEVTPYIPNTIYTGGELGHCLSVAYGSAFNNYDYFFPCIIGDGEFETGGIMSALNSTKFIDPNRDGWVLPIINLNGFKMTSNSILSTMKDRQLKNLFISVGYEPILVDGNNYSMYKALKKSVELYMGNFSKNDKFIYPLLIVKTPKGWTCPKKINGTDIENTFRAHKAPLKNPKKSIEELKELEKWLKSYCKFSFFDKTGNIVNEILEIIPDEKYRLFNKKQICLNNDSNFNINLNNYMLKKYEVCNSMEKLSKYVSDIIKNNDRFMIFSPDELVSNGFGKVLEFTNRRFNGFAEKKFNSEGQVLEILNENICEAWLQGYIQCGGYGIFVMYESFATIISSMLIQYAKHLKMINEAGNRVNSLNIILSSLCWRNCYTHQNPDIYNNLIGKQFEFINLYFPCDVNSLIYATDVSINSKNNINIIASSKTNTLCILSKKTLEDSFDRGFTIIEDCIDPEVVYCSIGDINTTEMFDAFNELSGKVKIKFITIINLTVLSKMNKGSISQEEFEELFNSKYGRIFSFVGYSSTVKSLLYDYGVNDIVVFGYNDYGGENFSYQYLLKKCKISSDEIIKETIRLIGGKRNDH